jgi:hypothetical protein
MDESMAKRTNGLRMWMRAAAVSSVMLLTACGGEPDDWIAAEEPSGTVVETHDRNDQPDVCLEWDICPDEDPPVEEGEPEEPTPEDTGLEAGDKMLVRKYTYFRKSPKPEGDVIKAIAPNGGASGAGHGNNPAGMVVPGQRVTLLDPMPDNGYLKVRYDEREGWISRKKLIYLDKSVHPVDFAMRPKVRNAFFKRQVRWWEFNQDGPMSSSNCGPTSMAMARAIFRKEPMGLSVEQSIHKVRDACCGGSDSQSTLMSDLVSADGKLGLDAVFHSPRATLEAAMDFIDSQLKKKKLFQLRGRAGSAYRSAMTAAHKDAGVSYTYTFGAGPSDFHSILVVGLLDNGKYLVADPLSRVGMVPLTRAKLKSYINVASYGYGISYRAK